MKPIFKVLYRAEGVRFSTQILNLAPYRLLQFPRGSLYHYVDFSRENPNVDPSLPIFSGYQKRICVENVLEYAESLGPVRKVTFNVREAARAWRQANRSKWTEVVNPIQTEVNPDVLIVENYGYLDHTHAYQNTQIAKYYQWHNLYKTVYARVNEIAAISERQQFLYYPMPKLIQGRTILEKFEKETVGSLRTVSFFGNQGDAGYMSLDMWKWLSMTHRQNSLLSTIDPRHYAKVNLVFVGENGHEVWVNMAYLNSWIKGNANTTELTSINQLDPRVIQNLYLRMSMSLNTVNLETIEPLPDQKEIDQLTNMPKVSEEPSAAVPDSTSLEKEDAAILDDEDETSSASGLIKQDTTPSVKKAVVQDPDKEILHEDITLQLMSELNKDIEALDRLNLVQLKNSGKKLNAPAEPTIEEEFDPEEIRMVVFEPKEPLDALRTRLQTDAEANLITASDYRKLEETIQAYVKSSDPYGSKLSRKEAMVIKPEHVQITEAETQIASSSSVPDKTMAVSSLLAYDKKYINTVHRKDILKAVDAIQGNGVVIKNHEVEIRSSVLGTYEHHRIELKPVDGAPSNIQFTLPVVSEDGTFLAGGNKYLMRKQRVDLPIRKIAPHVVALSTYYGKTFVQTSPRASNSSLTWLYRQINLKAMSGSGSIKNLNPGNVFDNDFKAPYLYNALANEYESFKGGDCNFIFDHRKALNYLSSITGYPRSLYSNGAVFCGYADNGDLLSMRSDGSILRYAKSGEQVLSLYDLLGLDRTEAPIDFAEVRIFSKYIPVGVVLSYYLGFNKLLALLNEPYRVVEGRRSKELAKDEYAISFKDKSLIFKTKNTVNTLILAGFNEYAKIIRAFDLDEFNHRDVYLNVLMAKRMAAIYIRELDMMETAFIDPITKEVLEEMKEPTRLIPLIIRAAELLTTYHHPASQDRSAMRERGYERFAGTIYKELSQAVRQFRNKNMTGRAKIDMSPFQVWNAILKDNSLKIVEDTNPIQSLKEQEVITYTGTGGRNKDTMTRETRAYHPNDIGVLSESTVDSTSVGTIAYLSANPNISSVRGLMKEEKTLNPTSILSTSALLSPAAMNDNPKRVMFIATQHSHTIASSGYRQPRLRTGYEFVIGKRTPKLFCTSADEDGEVISKSEKGLVVRYASGKEVGIDLGRQYGKAEGTTYPHDLTTELTLGQKFKAGSTLAYNSKFFEPDFLNPSEVVLKVNDVVRTAFVESGLTHEDSCSVSRTLSDRFQTEVIKLKSFVVKFTQNLINVVKPGSRVDPKTVLMIIEDEITANTGAFSQDSLLTLRRLSNASPKAGVMGVVEKIEVFYHGDKRDMSTSIKKLAEQSDADLSAAAKSTNRPIVNGRVTDEYRVSGTPLEPDHAEIKIYISVKAGTGVGDKAVFGHQMKSTIAEVMPEPMHTETGEPVEAIFGYRSVANRGVLSPAIIGTTITLLDVIGKKAVEIYEA